MAKKLYVGNLSYDMTDSDLENLFEPHGAVPSAQVIMDRDTGRSKGFGFVEMDSGEQAEAAIAALNGQAVGGRALPSTKPDHEKTVAAVGAPSLAAKAAAVLAAAGATKPSLKYWTPLPGAGAWGGRQLLIKSSTPATMVR